MSACNSFIVFNDSDNNVIKMMNENNEEFSELVLSHITRLLDLPGEQLDVLRGQGLHHPGGKRAWKKKNLKNAANHSLDDVLPHIAQLAEFIKQNLTATNFFLKEVNTLRQNQLLEGLSTGVSIDFEKSNFQTHDAANVLKFILCQLPEPLLYPSKHFGAHVQISKMNIVDTATKVSIPNKGKRIETLQLLMFLLPVNHRRAVQCIFNLLFRTAKHQTDNKMNASLLSTIFTSQLIWPPSMKQEDYASATSLNEHVAFMIRHSEKIFVAPPYLRHAANFFFASVLNASAPSLMTYTSTHSMRFADQCVQECQVSQPEEKVLKEKININTDKPLFLAETSNENAKKFLKKTTNQVSKLKRHPTSSSVVKQKNGVGKKSDCKQYYYRFPQPGDDYLPSVRDGKENLNCASRKESVVIASRISSNLSCSKPTQLSLKQEKSPHLKRTTSLTKASTSCKKKKVIKVSMV